MFSSLRVPVLGLSLALAAATAGCKKEATPPPPPAAPAPAPAPAVPAAVAGRVEMEVTTAGFVPARVPAKAGQKLTLAITRKTDATCARQIRFAGQEGETELPLNKTVEVTYTPRVSGEVKFGCAMGMMVSGVLAVTE